MRNNNNLGSGAFPQACVQAKPAIAPHAAHGCPRPPTLSHPDDPSTQHEKPHETPGNHPAKNIGMVRGSVHGREKRTPTELDSPAFAFQESERDPDDGITGVGNDRTHGAEQGLTTTTPPPGDARHGDGRRELGRVGPLPVPVSPIAYPGRYLSRDEKGSQPLRRRLLEPLGVRAATRPMPQERRRNTVAVGVRP